MIGRLVNKLGEPVIRQAVNQAMKIMGRHFVLGRNISEALRNGLKQREKGYTYSFDMLGESALTMEDARRYHDEYLAAIRAVAAEPDHGNSPRAGISIKLLRSIHAMKCPESADFSGAGACAGGSGSRSQGG